MNIDKELKNARDEAWNASHSAWIAYEAANSAAYSAAYSVKDTVRFAARWSLKCLGKYNKEELLAQIDIIKEIL